MEQKEKEAFTKVINVLKRKKENECEKHQKNCDECLNQCCLFDGWGDPPALSCNYEEAIAILEISLNED